MTVIVFGMGAGSLAWQQGPGDTWGISGPDFLSMFAIALGAAALLIILVSRWPTKTVTPTGELPVEVLGHVAGGPDQAFHTAVAGLVAEGVISAQGKRQLLTDAGAATFRPTPLQAAILRAIDDSTPPSKVSRNPAVREELQHIRDRAAAEGWEFDAPRRSMIRLAWYLYLAICVVGVIRLIAGIVGDKPVTFLVMMILLAAPVIAGLAMWLAADRTRAGTALVREVGDWFNGTRTGRQAGVVGPSGVNLAPLLMASAALGVAVGGASAMRALNPGVYYAMGGTTAGGGGSGDVGGISCSGGSCGGGGGSGCGG